MLTLVYMISLWYFSRPMTPPTSADTCYAEDGDIALSQKTIEAWTLLHAKCSCFIALTGSEQSEFSIVMVKAYAGQQQPRLSAMLSVTKAFPDNVSELPVLLNGHNMTVKATPIGGTFTVELDSSTDWIAAISEAKTLQIGDYNFTSAQSQTAMRELQMCYTALKGQ